MSDGGNVNDNQIRRPHGDINAFWNDFDWEDMTAAEQHAWRILGWNAASWNEEINAPISDEAMWNELTMAEQMAAEKLGYNQVSWDEA